MKRILLLALASVSIYLQAQQQVQFPTLSQVRLDDPFWTPIMSRTSEVTIHDVLQKFYGNHSGTDTSGGGENYWSPDRNRMDAGKTGERNTLRNFELVAAGHVGDGGHVGFPWFDGLIYETITGCSDFLFYHRNEALIQEIDAIVERIEAAQNADADGYINTYTTLEENNHRWGENGGNLRWQHDVYNSGCLVEAGVHYYKATGHTRLLDVALRLANYMYDYMAGANHNVIPGHALPEDALMQLYALCQEEPDLHRKVKQPIHALHYRQLAEFWIEQRGHTQGRRALEPYAQDGESVFEAQTIEGHAVRATLFATGVADCALANREQRYIDASHRLWNNMVGKRMFITGGVGAIHEDEKFGPDYYLPCNAYLETCAAIGAGLFSWRMYELTGNPMYMDVVERILYNSIPTAVSQSGTNYTYQNPLNADGMSRWPWHDCPCCPPMLLKWLGQLPRMIYAHNGNDLYVNLFVGGSTTFQSPYYGTVTISQEVDWLTGRVTIHTKATRHARDLRLNVRVPGWMSGHEMPLDLYHNDLQAPQQNGYQTYCGMEASEVAVQLDMSPRMVTADEHVAQLQGMKSLAAGPFVYCLERIDNEEEWNTLTLVNRHFTLHTQSSVTGCLPDLVSDDNKLRAIPYYYIANRSDKTSYRVWVSAQQNTLTIHPDKVLNRITPYLYGAGMEDVNHEVYGGFYDQQLFGESFEEDCEDTHFCNFTSYDHAWRLYHDQIYPLSGKTAKLVYNATTLTQGSVEVEIRYDGLQGAGNAAGLSISTSECGDGADNFRGYEVALHGSGRYIILGKHNHNFQAIRQFPVTYEPTQWNKLRVDVDGAHLVISLNGTKVGEWEDTTLPLPSGYVAFRTYEADPSYRNLTITCNGKTQKIDFLHESDRQVSRMWGIDASADSDAHYTIIRGKGVKHGWQAQKVENSSQRGRVSLYNQGLNHWGISVRKGHAMRGSLWVKGNARTVSVALCSKDGSRDYAQQQLSAISGKWRRLEFELTPSATDTVARFEIRLQGKGSLTLDACELMHTGDDQYKGMPLRADIGHMFDRQGLSFLRYGGSMVNSPEYRYSHMRGERQLRQPYRGHWYRYATNGFGIQEFVDFATAQQYALSFAVNIEDSPEDCAQMIRELKGRIKYVEIGNEEVLINDRADHYDHYVERFVLLSEAMKAVDPSLEFVCSAWWRPESPNVERTFRALDGKAHYWDYHPWTENVQQAGMVEGELRRMQALFRQWNPQTAMRCAILEENGNTHDMERALAHVVTQNAVRRMGDFVLTTCPANALEPYKQNDNGWNQGQIFFTPSQTWGMPPYYAQQIASLHHQPLLVESMLDKPNPNLDITATRSEDGSQTVLHIVNAGSDIQQLQLAGVKATAASVTTLSGDGPSDHNTPQRPEHIIPRTVTADVSTPLTLAPHSYTIVAIKRI